MIATTSLRERLLAIEDDLHTYAITQGEIGLRGACIEARNKLREIRKELLSTPPAGELRALAHDMGMFLNRYRAVLPSQAMAESYALHNRLNALAWNAASTPEPATQEVG